MEPGSEPDSPVESEAPKVAIALEDRELRARLVALLRNADLAVRTLDVDEPGWWKRAAQSGATVLVVRKSELTRTGADAVLDGMAADGASPEVLVVSDNDDPAGRAQAMAAGAAGVLDLGASNPDLRSALETVAAALAERGRAHPQTGGRPFEPRLADFLSRSPRMNSFLGIVERIKGSDSSLLIVGETGVGKEHLARAIHAESARSGTPFVSVNCGAIPEHLLESELFGHEKGAFTGAAGRREGRFREAHGGTIFLDEIGDLPKHLQVNLLTVLQRREVRPLGAQEPIPVDVRVMAATNRDLAADVSAGKFREDLYFRLNVVPLEIPPLRERREDIPEFVGSFMRHFQVGLERDDVKRISPNAMARLLSHDWPGNLRELINVVERAMLLCRGDTITAPDLPEPLGTLSVPAVGPNALALPSGWETTPLQELKKLVVEELERRYLHRLLERAGGRVGEAARMAGVAERTLYEKMKRQGLRKEDFRE